MGQKIHPLGFRLGVTQKHRSTWFASPKKYPQLMLEDRIIRSEILKSYPKAKIVHILIERRQTNKHLTTKKPLNLVKVNIQAAVPSDIFKSNATESIKNLSEKLIKKCKKIRTGKNLPELRFFIVVNKIPNPSSEASVLADLIIEQLEKRVPFRKAVQQCIRKVEKSRLKGARIQISGRLNGAEMARTEWTRYGQVPLQTLRADVEYCAKTAKTVYGILGVKIWTFKGYKTDY